MVFIELDYVFCPGNVSMKRLNVSILGLMLATVHWADCLPYTRTHGGPKETYWNISSHNFNWFTPYCHQTTYPSLQGGTCFFIISSTINALIQNGRSHEIWPQVNCFHPKHVTRCILIETKLGIRHCSTGQIHVRLLFCCTLTTLKILLSCAAIRV